MFEFLYYTDFEEIYKIANAVTYIIKDSINVAYVEEKSLIVDNLARDKHIFSNQVDAFLLGKYPKRDMLIVSNETPTILQKMGLKDLPITMTQKHLYTIIQKDGKYNDVNYHNIDVDVIKQLPNALYTPLNILKSDTKNDSIVVVTELSDKNNNIIIASIKIDGIGTIQDIRINSNVMTSAYGKSNYDNFMKKNIAKGNLLYDIDKGIIKRVTRDRVQFPMRDNSTTSNISQSDEHVK